MNPSLTFTEGRRFQRQREALIGLLREKGIADERVLEAMRAIPRHLFLDSALWPRAYEDTALPIGFGQTISQPFTVAYQTQLLAPQPGDRVLEIGTGSGYQTAILCALGAEVYSVERIEALARRAQERLRALGFDAVIRVGDGSMGWPEHAPYQGILVTAGAPRIPEPLLEQLAIGGRLVIPVGDAQDQRMYRVQRLSQTAWQQEIRYAFRFVPLIGEEGWQEDPEGFR
ncbi:MAG: protein-L-isoaspartate(D-aspartate) O-methyltransferase [Bacteroidetes bacterium]|nr:protein-L-isoaspartate(D-aspartate) O-methyltransferase [Bacteroidota bacterium]